MNAAAFVEYVLLNYDHRLVLLNEEACGMLRALLRQERCEELLLAMCQSWPRFEALAQQYCSNPGYAPSTTVVLTIFRLAGALRPCDA